MDKITLTIEHFEERDSGLFRNRPIYWDNHILYINIGEEWSRPRITDVSHDKGIVEIHFETEVFDDNN